MARPTIKFKCMSCQKVLSSRPSMRHHLAKLHSIPDMCCDHYALVWLKPKDPLTVSQPQPGSSETTTESPNILPPKVTGFKTPHLKSNESVLDTNALSQPISSAPEVAVETKQTSPEKVDKEGDCSKTKKNVKVSKVVKKSKGFDYFKGLTSEVEFKMENFKMWNSKVLKQVKNASAPRLISGSTTITASQSEPSPSRHLAAITIEHPAQEIDIPFPPLSPDNPFPPLSPEILFPPLSPDSPFPVLSPVYPVPEYLPSQHLPTNPKSQRDPESAPSQPSTSSGTLPDPGQRTVHKLAAKKTSRKPKHKCENASCEPCSILENCNVCYFCLNRSRLRQKCSKRQCRELNSKLPRKQFQVGPDEVVQEVVHPEVETVNDNVEVVQEVVHPEVETVNDNVENEVRETETIGNQRSDDLNTEEIIESILRTVVESANPTDSLKVPIKYQPKPKIFECKKCQKTFAQHKSLQKHERKCTGSGKPTPVICQTCKNPFYDKQTLKRHMERRHNKPEVVFRCEECDIQFAMKHKLKEHNVLKHGLEIVAQKLVKCPYPECDFKHQKERYIKAHITNRHTISTPKLCTICPFKCKSDGGLVRHMRVVHTVSSREEIEMVQVDLQHVPVMDTDNIEFIILDDEGLESVLLDPNLNIELSVENM